MEDNQNKNNILENEAEIVKRAQDDDQAFTILYNHYFPKIYGYLYKRTSKRESAEDLSSEVFMKVFSNLGKYKNQGYTFGAWVYRIATNALIDYYRKQGKVTEVDINEFFDLESDEEAPDYMVSKMQDREQIEKVLEHLPPRYREIINLKYFAELDITEIAVILKLSNNNVAVLTHRALRLFKKKYQQIAKKQV